MAQLWFRYHLTLQKPSGLIFQLTHTVRGRAFTVSVLGSGKFWTLSFPQEVACKSRGDSSEIWIRLLPRVLWSSLPWTLLATPKTQNSSQSTYLLHKVTARGIHHLACKTVPLPTTGPQWEHVVTPSHQLSDMITQHFKRWQALPQFSPKTSQCLSPLLHKTIVCQPCATLELEEREVACVRPFFQSKQPTSTTKPAMLNK